jgi:hypothetical protein
MVSGPRSNISKSNEAGCARRGCLCRLFLRGKRSRSTLAVAIPVSRDVPNARASISHVDRGCRTDGDFRTGRDITTDSHPYPVREPRAHADGDGNGDYDSDRDPSTHGDRGTHGHAGSHASAGHAYSHADSRPDRGRDTHVERYEFHASMVVVADRRDCAGSRRCERVLDPKEQPEASMGRQVVFLRGGCGMVRPRAHPASEPGSVRPTGRRRVANFVGPGHRCGRPLDLAGGGRNRRRRPWSGPYPARCRTRSTRAA